MHFGYCIFRSSSLTIKHKSPLKALLLLHLIWTHASVFCDVWGRGRCSVKYKDYCKVRLAPFERGSMTIKRINKKEENAPSFWCGCGIASTKTQPGFSSSPFGCSMLLVWEHSTLVWGVCDEIFSLHFSEVSYPSSKDSWALCAEYMGIAPEGALILSLKPGDLSLSPSQAVISLLLPLPLDT